MGYNTDFVGYLEPNRDFTENEISIIDNFNNNRHDSPEYPGIWCQWTIENGVLEWDGNEKFYNYVEWLQYLIDNFFITWRITLNGVIIWQGEDIDDRGKITVVNNIINKINLE